MKKRLLVALACVCAVWLVACAEVPHTHTPADPVRENEVAATCTAEGSYEEVVKCAECGEELSRTAKTVEKIAHAFATVKENEVAATCTAEGSYDEVVKCAECGEELSRTAKTVEKIAHAFATVKENEVAATCTAEGSYDEVVKCSVCDEELSRTAKTVEKIAHTPAEPIRENEKAATCAAEGSYDEVVKCSVCDEEISRESKTEKKLAHSFSSENHRCASCLMTLGVDLKFASNGDGTCTVTGRGSCFEGSIIIPETSPAGERVTAIGEGAFEDNLGLFRIEIGDSVTSIGKSAFRTCKNLESVILGSAVTSIDTEALYYCYGLTDIIVSSENTTFFSLDGNLYSKDGKTLVRYAMGKTEETFTVPDTVEIIGDHAFDHCNHLLRVVIGDRVTSIGNRAFYTCENLRHVVIGDGVASIGYSAFGACWQLESIYIENIVAWCSISFGDSGANPLSTKAKLYLKDVLVTDLVLPNGITDIGDYAFYNYKSLVSITFPDSVTSIGDAAFQYCTSLLSVTFKNPNGWTADGTPLSPSDLSDLATAATYVKNTYTESLWTRE